jgi:hypothetical protein
LNEMVNENKADVQKLYDKIKNNMNWSTPWENENEWPQWWDMELWN